MKFNRFARDVIREQLTLIIILSSINHAESQLPICHRHDVTSYVFFIVLTVVIVCVCVHFLMIFLTR